MCANFISLIIDLCRIIFRPWSVALETSISSTEVLNTALNKLQRFRIFLSAEPQKPKPTLAQIQSLCTLGCSKARWSLGTLNCIDTRLPLKVNQPWNMNTVRHSDLAVTSIPAESLESCRGHGSSNYFPHTASSSSFQYQTNRRQTCTNQRGELICQHFTLVLAIIRNQRYRNKETELWQKTGYIFNIHIPVLGFRSHLRWKYLPSRVYWFYLLSFYPLPGILHGGKLHKCKTTGRTYFATGQKIHKVR